MMRTIQKRIHAMSRRTLSIISAVAVFATMILAVVSGVLFVSIAGNPATVAGLNTTATVQEINLLPVDPKATGSRTSLSVSTAAKTSYLYSEIRVQDDESVDFVITKETDQNQNANNNTAYVEAFTKIGQKINLAENPWLMMKWSGSGRCNGRVYFTVTNNGVEYGRSNTVISDDYFENSDLQTLLSGGKLFAINLNNIVSGNSAGYSNVNHTDTDFNAGTVADYSIDFYKYLYDQVQLYKTTSNDGISGNTQGISLAEANWPTGSEWADSENNYITIYMSCQIMASESEQPLTAGTYINWTKFALGRAVLERPASMLPRNVDYMNITNEAGTANVDYGRVSALDNGAVTFRNTSDTDSVLFKWNLRRYFNATELEALLVDATFSGMTYDQMKLQAWYGGRTTTYVEPERYNYRGANEQLSRLISGYSTESSITTSSVSAVVDFNEYLNSSGLDDSTDYSYPYSEFYPDDSLIFIGDVTLLLPAGAEVTFARLEFQIENEKLPATKADTAYPWATDEVPVGLPPEGTAALSTALNTSDGVSYEWATAVENAPTVAVKVDLLAQKTYQFCQWDMDVITSATDTTDVLYTRKPTGESVYSSNGQTDITYYRVMRYGPSDTWSGNYYLSLDTNNLTPYLYYSYELIDTTPNDNAEPSAGFYFHFANSDRETYITSNNETKFCYTYYLDQSGITLRQCNTFFTHDAKYAAEAIMSPSNERTGCIDIRSLYSPSTGYLKLEDLRIYLAPGTDIQINYLFLGGSSLDDSAKGSIATQGNQAYAWTVDKETFDAKTDPDSDSAQYTFANKVDVLADLQDRAVINGLSDLPNATVNTDGSVTLAVTDTSDLQTGYLTNSSVSFDHNFGIQVATTGDLSSIRYLNYSVNAPSGMRWTIILHEHSSQGGEKAILTWADTYSRWNDDDRNTDTPAGISNFRFLSGAEYGSTTASGYWYQHNNTSFRIYAIPGSQTGCVDLQQVVSTFDMKNIVSISLIAYRDPRLALADGESASVTFNYVYLTSELVKTESAGSAATSAGTSYSWGGKAVTTAPSVATKRNFVYQTYANGIIDYQLTDANGNPAEMNVDLSATPYLYYSFRYIDTVTGKTVAADGTPLRIGMSILENNTYYYRRNTAGSDSAGIVLGDSTTGYLESLAVSYGANRGHGKPSFIRLSTNTETAEKQVGKAHDSASYYLYGGETGCINLADYFIGDNTILNRVRFYVNSTQYATVLEDGTTRRYQLVMDYLFLGTAATSQTALTQTHRESLASAPATEDFHNIVWDKTGEFVAQTLPLSMSVDLSATPYLYYSVRYAAGDKGTFGLTTDRTVGGSDTFFRDVGQTSGLISAGDAPTSNAQYMQQSETGCIDVRGWYRKNGYTGDVLNISAVHFWGSDFTVKYLYFGAESDATIDLIPATAGGSLQSGTPTAAWTVTDRGTSAETSPVAGVYKENGEVNWDQWDTNSSSSVPTTGNVKYAQDQSNDGFNDLWYQNNHAFSINSICYGTITVPGTSGNYNYITTGNNQTSGLTIDLNETPYLHYSIEQPEDSVTTFLLQTNNHTASVDMYGQSADKVRPWLSAYLPNSPAGQLIQIVANSNIISYYKDMVMDTSNRVSGNFAGVIDLRSWYTQTNGFDDVISLERVRFYTFNESNADVKVNYFYLSSSAGASYRVTFNKNDQSDDTDEIYTQQVLKNANAQYISDEAAAHLKVRDGYTFMGWYTDEECENYFDLQSTVLTTDITLYAGWLNNENVVDSDDLEFLTLFDASTATISGTGEFTLDGTGLRLTGGGAWDSYYTVTFPVNKAYSVTALKSLFVGVDTDRTSYGFDIIMNVKSRQTATYNLISDVFQTKFLNDSQNLMAGPYDRELDMYTHLGILNNLPARENVNGYLLVNSISVKVPGGMYAELRYLKAGDTVAEEGNLNVRAPATSNSIDLLKNLDSSSSFVTMTNNVVYMIPDSQSVTYMNNLYTQASINGLSDGYVHFGVYTHTIDMAAIRNGNTMNRYLYFSIDQPKNSYTTFALYASFSGRIEQGTDTTPNYPVYDIQTLKSISYFSADAAVSSDSNSVVANTYGGMAQRTYEEPTENFSPVQSAYINGSFVGVIDLYEWYKDALVPYRNNSEVDNVELLGLRFYTTAPSTDVVVNYMFIGDAETTAGKETHLIYAEYPFGAGSGDASHNPTYAGNGSKAYEDHRCYLSDVQLQRGDTLYVSLDDLVFKAGDAPLDDPTKVFLGWAFRDFMFSEVTSGGERVWNGKLIYWNPAATNGNRYDPHTNPGGSWSLSQYPGFVTDQKSVFYTFNTINNLNTQIITPIFADAAYQPTLTVTPDGGNVNVQYAAAQNETIGAQMQYAVPFDTTVVLSAVGDDFTGWYDAKGILLSITRDIRVDVMTDTAVVARFGAEESATDMTMNSLDSNTDTIIWLQAGDQNAGAAGTTTGFYLLSVNNGDIAMDHTYNSGFDSVQGTDIACYWNILDGQLVTAVAKSGYHWEQELADGSAVRVSGGNEYTFVACANTKLICVADNSSEFTGSVAINNIAVAPDLHDHDMVFYGKITPKNGAELVTCGVVMIDSNRVYPVPSLESAGSITVTASAWNSTTGQFSVKLPVADGAAYHVRAFAIFRDSAGDYTICYSDNVAEIV